MPVDQRVSVFTDRMRTEFYNSYSAVVTPAPWESFTTRIPSTARIEHYPWMSPAPGIQQYKGHRRFGKLDTVRYSLENKEFDAAFSVLTRDLEDDLTGGYEIKSRELADQAAAWPGRWVIRHLAAGGTRLCFDGTAMFADSHAIGTGDNLMAFDGAANDAATFNIACLYVGAPLKPLLWQDRKPPKFMDNAGTPQSSEAKEIHYWIDLEGEAGYGMWWNGIWVDITDTPSVAEFQTILQQVMTRFRTFVLPKALAADEDQYVHEQTVFNSGNFVIVGSTGLEVIADKALNETIIATTETVSNTGVGVSNNLFKNKATFIASAYMN